LIVRRGDLYYAELSPVMGSEQGGLRPVLIVQNDVGNKYSPTVIAAAITSQINKAKLPTHIELQGFENGLARDSVILLEQIRTIDKKRLKERIGQIDNNLLKKVNNALCISFGIPDYILGGYALDTASVYDYNKLQR
jgi:mRNA interferase MazF